MDDINLPNSTPYDTVAYPSAIFLQTHPNRLAVLARLHGLIPPDVETARVLEIGGGDGLNLIAMGAAFPHGKFLSFDLAPSAVKRGNDLAALAGLDNVQVVVGDILDMHTRVAPASYDYIIAHGVYAWVPEVVRGAIMKLLAHALSPHGVAFVSYNARPGGHLRMVMRDMLLHELDGINGEATRIAAARAFLGAYKIAQDGDDAVVTAMRKQAEAMFGRPDEVLFHDELGAVFAPQSLMEINQIAAAHGLRYLNDAGTNRTHDGFLVPDKPSVPDAQTAVERVAQSGDYAAMRFFRQNLYVRQENVPERRPNLAAMDALFVAGYFSPADDGGLRHGDDSFVLRDPALTAKLLELDTHWPRYVRCNTIFHSDTHRSGLLDLWHKGLIFMSTTPERFATEVKPKPCASPLARAQATIEKGRICTLSHELLVIQDPVARTIIAALDGQRDLDALNAIWGSLPHHPDLELGDALKALAAKRLLIRS